MRITVGGVACGLAAVLGFGSVAIAQDAVQWRVEDGGNGHWYQFRTFGQNCFLANRDAAVELGGHLMTANGEAEWIFVSDHAQEVGTPSFIIGAVGPAHGTPGWTWVTGEPWDYTAWGGQSPCSWGPYPNNGSSGYYLWTGACGNSPSGALLWDDGAQFNQCNGPAMLCMVEWSADCNGDGIVDYGQILDGTLIDKNGNGIPDCCEFGFPCFPDPCPGDLNNDAVVNGGDISVLLGFWGQSGKGVLGDINGDGLVDAADLAMLLSSWGKCP
jgi:hypothetical protein